MTIIAETTTEQRDVYPVFRGLSELGLSTADLAMAMSASQTDVAAWRSGEERMPARLIAFLTLILDALIERRGTEATVAASFFPEMAKPGQIRTVRARDNLQQQQAFNCGFDKAHMDAGLRLFQRWRDRKLFADHRFVGAERGRAFDMVQAEAMAT
tara:strand:+ start:201 stop:668 length:468 start_codon:yes stop_codon:yes gene_type:complete